MRLKLTIAYDGAPYSGWQYQPGMVTVQETVERALSEIAKSEIKVYASGRTDAGVHADGQVVHFDPPEGSRMQPENWVAAVNTRLPASIRILGCERVESDFHARFSAISKTYEYVIETRGVLHPHNHNRVWHIPQTLELDQLKACLEGYVGEHNFRHFSALRGNETEDTSYVRCLTEASVEQSGTQLLLRYSSNGFLYKMVRILTGVAVSTAIGRLGRQEFEKMLTDTDADCNTAKYCAPAAGLFLKSVNYCQSHLK